MNLKKKVRQPAVKIKEGSSMKKTRQSHNCPQLEKMPIIKLDKIDKNMEKIEYPCHRVSNIMQIY